MADNKYENLFCFVESSTTISNYLMSYYNHCKILGVIHTSIGIPYYITQEVVPVFLKSGLK